MLEPVACGKGKGALAFSIGLGGVGTGVEEDAVRRYMEILLDKCGCVHIYVIGTFLILSFYINTVQLPGALPQWQERAVSIHPRREHPSPKRKESTHRHMGRAS